MLGDRLQAATGPHKTKPGSLEEGAGSVCIEKSLASYPNLCKALGERGVMFCFLRARLSCADDSLILPKGIMCFFPSGSYRPSLSLLSPSCWHSSPCHLCQPRCRPPGGWAIRPWSDSPSGEVVVVLPVPPQELPCVSNRQSCKSNSLSATSAPGWGGFSHHHHRRAGVIKAKRRSPLPHKNAFDLLQSRTRGERGRRGIKSPGAETAKQSCCCCCCCNNIPLGPQSPAWPARDSHGHRRPRC